MTIEMTVIATDEAPDQSKAERVKFQLEFMQMMLMVGRVQMAEDALSKCFDLLNEMIEEGE